MNIAFKLVNKTEKLVNRRTVMNVCSSKHSKEQQFTGKKNSICVVGGGFAGLYSALKLEELVGNKVDITLIDKKDKFVFLPLLYELATGAASVAEVAPLYTDLLTKSKIKFVKANVETVNFDSKEVTYKVENTDSSILHYDYLVLGAGGQPRVDLIEGSKDHAIPFYLAENAYQLKMKLQKLISSDLKYIRVSVIGGGYSGVELATHIAEYIGKKRAIVTLIDRNSRVMSNSPEYNRKTAER